MKTPIFKGAGVAIVTPMNDDGSICFDELGRLIEFQIAGKTDAIIICGTTGENATMNDEEHIATMKYAIEKVNGRIPVIAGTGSNDTAHAIYLSRVAEDLGADGILLVTPYYNKATQLGLIKHFSVIANSVKLPIVLYNVPSRTGLNMDISTVKELAKIDNINSIKEASGNINYLANLMAECKDSIYMYSGNDDMITPAMSLGGIGVISVLSNIMPLETHQIVEDCLNNDFFKAMKAQLAYEKLIKALFCEVNPIPVKEALRLMGYKVGHCRLPLCEMSPKNQEFLKECLREHNLI